MLSALMIDAFSSPLLRDDPRAERAVLALESVWPVHLVCEISDTGQRIRHDHDRPSYLVSRPRELAFIATPDDEEDANLGGLVEPGPLAPGGVDELHVLGQLPSVATASASLGLERFADALHASWAMLTPDLAHGAIVDQVIDRDDADEQPTLGLPRLDLAEHLAQHQPRRLGWINYWSDAAAAAAGFTAAADDVFATVRRVANGWIAQLTEDPLDLDRDNHVAALRRAYERYPRIGRTWAAS